ncbi:hypothetical protein LCGC14_2504500 [marine sediment metagenome]|uniref:Uncharacterized protein n=1 Tax=marine sediment metagenome TaxID=412755 RepID=A0A0F9DUI7_9ZZZZ
MFLHRRAKLLKIAAVGGTDVDQHSYTVVNQGTATAITITSSDLNKIHVLENVAALVITLPLATAALLGSWITFRKKAAGDVTANANGSDAIADGTSIANTVAAQTWAEVTLVIDKAGNWGISPMLGSWVTS